MQRKIGDKVKITSYFQIYYGIIGTIYFSKSDTTEKHYYIGYDIFGKKNELSTPTQEELDLYFREELVVNPTDELKSSITKMKELVYEYKQIVKEFYEK